MIHIGIVDNDDCALIAISSLIRATSKDFSVVWQVNDAQQALAHTFHYSPKAQVIVMDMGLCGICGTQICECIRRHDATVGIIGITAYPTELYRDDCIHAGAQALIEKRRLAYGENIAPLIRSAARGLPYPSGSGFYDTHTAYQLLRTTKEHDARTLTNRELIVLKLYANHCSTNQIAQRLKITSATVFSHVRNAVGKLDASDKREAIQLCLKQHLF